MAKAKNPATIDASISASWKGLKGFKRSYWGMFFKVVIPMIIIGGVLGMLMGISFGFAPVNHAGAHAMSEGLPKTVFNMHFTELLVKIICAPLSAALLMLAVKRVRGEETKKQSVFEYFPQKFQLMLLVLIWGVLFSLPLIVAGLLQLAGMLTAAVALNGILSVVALIAMIVLSPAMVISVPLLADKKLSAFDAFKKSIKYSMPIWHKLFILEVFAFIIFAFGAMLALIGLIWFLPYAAMITGSMYTLTAATHKL